MTREETIKLASVVNATSEMILGFYTKDKVQTYQKGFVRGAEWADKNPKSPWISVEDDLPFNHEELIDSKSKDMTFQVLIRYGDGRYGFSCMADIAGEWKWLNSWVKITHWMKVPETPKEE